ncbi:MAG: DUF3256 family protein [Dysgonamonadaceae bacterium]|jgi:hypothetical protein|nr:DUF3256 family protein [Dysgonamonadaceae bacterium]
MKNAVFGILMGFMTVWANAQTAKDLFVSLPDLLTLDVNSRLDLIDLYTVGEKAVVKNAFNDEISLVCLTDDYLSVKSGNMTVELFLLSLVNESKMIGLIQTSCAPICDSRLEFYALSWKKISPEMFIQMADQSWFIKAKDDFPAIDLSLMELHYNADKQLLTQTYNSPAYLSLEDKKAAAQNILENTKEYKWTGIRFE